MLRNPSVDRYIFELSEHDAVIMDILRSYIERLVPMVEESFKFKCPFYVYKGLLCYLNFEKKSKTVVLSFVEGCMLEDKYELLSRDTSQVRKLYFKSARDIKLGVIKYYLQQAVKVNESKKRNFLKPLAKRIKPQA
jgi:hypothetical protein